MDVYKVVLEGGTVLDVDEDYWSSPVLMVAELALRSTGGFRAILSPAVDPVSHSDHLHIEVKVETIEKRRRPPTGESRRDARPRSARSSTPLRTATAVEAASDRSRGVRLLRLGHETEVRSGMARSSLTKVSFARHEQRAPPHGAPAMMLRALVDLARQLELPGAGAEVDPDAAIAYVAALHGLIERGEAPGPDTRYGVRLGRDTAAVSGATPRSRPRLIATWKGGSEVRRLRRAGACSRRT